MPLVTDSGFKPDRWRRIGAGEPLAGSCTIVPLDLLDAALAAKLAADITALGVEVEADADLGHLLKRMHSVSLIALRFESFADGRGFSVARRLRSLGYTGRLRAVGDVIADQWAFLRDCGFDEAEIGDDLAARQPEESWRAAAVAISGSYQRKLVTPERPELAWTL